MSAVPLLVLCCARTVRCASVRELSSSRASRLERVKREPRLGYMQRRPRARTCEMPWHTRQSRHQIEQQRSPKKAWPAILWHAHTMWRTMGRIARTACEGGDRTPARPLQYG